MLEKKLYVMHIEKVSVQGRSSYSFDTTNGSSIPLGRSRARGIEIPYSFVRIANTNRLKTGLDEHTDNPYYQQELNEVPANLRVGSQWVDKYPGIKERETIPWQTLLEIIDNQPEGFYTSVCQMPTMAETGADKNVIIGKKPTFLEGFKYYLKEGMNVISSRNQRGRLATFLMYNHPRIASDRNAVNHDSHDFYIAEAEEAVKLQNKKINAVMQGMADLQLLLKNYDSFDAYQVAVVLGIAKGDQSPAVVENSLRQYVWEQKKNVSGTQTERVNKLSEVYNQLTADKDKLYIRYIVQQAVNTGLITTGSGYYIWRSKKEYDNLYRHSSLLKLETMLFNELEKYDPDIEEDNWFRDLEVEVKNKNVKCR